MSLAADINRALQLTELLSARALPAVLVPVLHEAGIMRAARGRPIHLTGQEALRLRARLVSRFELPERALNEPGFRLSEGADRIALARQIGNEKLGAAAVTLSRPPVHPGMVLLRRTASAAIEPLPVPEAANVARPGVILVENWLAFERFETLTFPVPAEFRGHAVLFRGDKEARQHTCESALALSGAPVVVFPDFDPAGLVNALAVPGMTRILWPGRAGLEQALREAATSEEKFTRQLPMAREKLARCSHPDVREIWEIIDRAGKVPAQEFFFAEQRQDRAQAVAR
ncbi:hypothetical protein LAZ40_05645 [Cereibacter sphaeroides]|uniref:DUF7281 domain-containing protein n=1 Tax=Cereibacter sphaeroides TaxID=1063 RepID=UPI001F2AE9EF|nr:hypothetical protein [Cereibacter sphaeroides]MCE6958533.1 hypothetical protein [Cereibacter sphaeroides]MCE6972804.1 hypothetical protein [Cereibacter sphaeroides]